MLPYLIAGHAVLVVFTWAAFGFDKRRARDGGRRVPETRLCLLAALGGAAGAWLGMRTFRHKTQKRSFQAKLALATAVWTAWLFLVVRAALQPAAA